MEVAVRQCEDNARGRIAFGSGKRECQACSCSVLFSLEAHLRSPPFARLGTAIPAVPLQATSVPHDAATILGAVTSWTW